MQDARQTPIELFEAAAVRRVRALYGESTPAFVPDKFAQAVYETVHALAETNPVPAHKDESMEILMSLAAMAPMLDDVEFQPEMLGDRNYLDDLRMLHQWAHMYENHPFESDPMAVRIVSASVDRLLETCIAEDKKNKRK